MNRRRCLLAALGLAVAIGSPLGACQTPAPPIGDVKPLGKDRFQIGSIVVDKRARGFTVPGRVHVLGKPLEYLATSPGGMKAYESLLELDATGSEFNLACILVGLERPPNQPAFQRYSREPLAGQRAALYIAWSEGAKQRELSAGDALLKSPTGGKDGIDRMGLPGVARLESGRSVRRRCHGDAGWLRARPDQRDRIGRRRWHRGVWLGAGQHGVASGRVGNRADR